MHTSALTGRRPAPATGTRQRGVTLVELVVAIVIVSIAAIAIMAAISMTLQRGAEAMVRQQAVALAEAYLEEILLQPVAVPTLPAGATAPTTRATFNDEDLYNNLSDTGAQDQYGNAIASLAAYNVSVAVAQTTALTGITAANARQITVTVTDPNGATVVLGKLLTWHTRQHNEEHNGVHNAA
jgi:MSHA pilin protein MshD